MHLPLSDRDIYNMHKQNKPAIICSTDGISYALTECTCLLYFIWKLISAMCGESHSEFWQGRLFDIKNALSFYYCFQILANSMLTLEYILIFLSSYGHFPLKTVRIDLT